MLQTVERSHVLCSKYPPGSDSPSPTPPLRNISLQGLRNCVRNLIAILIIHPFIEMKLFSIRPRSDYCIALSLSSSIVMLVSMLVFIVDVEVSVVVDAFFDDISAAGVVENDTL